MKTIHACLLCLCLLVVHCQDDLHLHHDHDHEDGDHQHGQHHRNNSIAISTTTNLESPNVTSTEEDDHEQRLLHNFNNRFESMRECRKAEKLSLGAGCECLWSMAHLRRIEVSNNNNEPSSNMGGVQQRRSLMLYNVLRMNPFYSQDKHKQDGYDHPQHDAWIQCSPTVGVCGETIRQTKRATMLSLLMPETMHAGGEDGTKSLNASIDSHLFAKDLEDLLQRLDRIVDKSTNVNLPEDLLNQSCFDAKDIVLELDRNNTRRSRLELIEGAASLIVDRLASGECIDLLESRFLKDIIQRYSKKTDTDHEHIANKRDHDHHNGEERQAQYHIDIKGFERMLNDLHIGGLIENTKTDDRAATSSPASNRYEIEGNDEHRHQDTNETQAYKSHREQRSVAREASESHNHIGHRHKHLARKQTASNVRPSLALRAMADDHQECLDYRFYINQLQQQENDDKAKRANAMKTSASRETGNDQVYLTPDRLQKMAPIILQQIVSRACERLEPQASHDEKHSDSKALNKLNSESNKKPKKWEVILYSTISVLVISLASLLGAVVVPFQGNRVYVHIISVLIGLAFGAMTGDALLHLLPSALGLHSHGENYDSGHHEHDHGEEIGSSYFSSMLHVFGAMFVLYLFETLSSLLANGHAHSHGGKIQAKDYDHHDHHNPAQSASTSTLVSSESASQHGKPKLAIELEKYLMENSKQMAMLTSLRQLDESGASSSSTATSRTSTNSLSSAESNKPPTPKKPATTVCFGLNSLAFMITAGDAVHNFFDGIAIGLAFSNSVTSGISTSIAVMFHELPHEFGDFAVLLSTGLSVRRAMAVNFITALTAFAGLFVGLVLGENASANRVALAITAGMFLYIGLAAMIPQLKNLGNENDELMKEGEELLSILFKSLGIAIGFGFMVFLSLFEDKLNFV